MTHTQTHRISRGFRTFLSTCVLIAGCEPYAAWRPRTILLYLDLSRSVAPSTIDDALSQLAGELRGQDRLVVLPITSATSSDAVPLYDEIVPGAPTDRFADALGLATRHSRQMASEQRILLLRTLVSASRRATLRYGRTGGTAIVDAVCHAGATARVAPTRPTFGILATDAVEESGLVNLALHVPSPAAATRLASEVRRAEACDLSAPLLRIRITGVRHARSTTALRLWWVSFLTGLGYRPRHDDVSTHPLSGLLSQAKAAFASSAEGTI